MDKTGKTGFLPCVGNVSNRVRQHYLPFTYIRYGCPLDRSGEYHWEVIKEKANLKRKTPDLIERYYVDFLTQCRNMISSNQNKQDKKSKGA